MLVGAHRQSLDVFVGSSTDGQSLTTLCVKKQGDSLLDQVEFQIKVESPMALTVDLARDLFLKVRPKWRITGIDLRRTEGNLFECKLQVAQGDLTEKNIAALIEFRDTFLSLVAFTAMAPLRLVTKGLATFPLGDNRFVQVSLGGTQKTFSPTTLPSISSILEGLAKPKVYLIAWRFIWQALNAEEPIHRFINLAVAYELIIGAESQASAPRAPVCQSCGNRLSSCPKCKKELKVPATLRERGAFLFVNKSELSEFVEFRNRVFHGGLVSLSGRSTLDLERLNNKLLVNIRNHLGQSLGLNAITENDLSFALNAPEIYMSVYYTAPSKSNADSIN